MRPANIRSPLAPSSLGDTSISSSSSATHTTLPSTTADKSEKGEHEDTRIWRGDDGDWTRVRDALRNFRSDGRRLECWERWLGLEARALLAHATERLGIGISDGTKVRIDDWDLRHALDPISPISNDATTPGTAQTRVPPPSREIVLAVLRENVSFPDKDVNSG
jgi:hypothetical protein